LPQYEQASREEATGGGTGSAKTAGKAKEPPNRNG
jgi:hypothetical protein